MFGATGGTGQHAVAQALARGHQVTAFVRDPSRLTTAPQLIRVIVGDVTGDDEAIAAAVRGQDVVISALGVGKSFKPGGLIAGSVPRIVRAMEREGARRLLHTSAFGVGETFRDAPFVPRMFIRTLLRNVYADKLVGDDAIRSSTLDWTIAYPAGLTDGPRTGQYRVGERLPLRGLPTISRADVADFLLNEAEANACVRKGVLISR